MSRNSGRSTRAEKGTSARLAAAGTERRPKKRPSPPREQYPSWRLALIDLDGPWAWAKARPAEQGAIVSFLREMERLTWPEIRTQQAGGHRRRGPKHKYIPMEHCASAAQSRLEELELEDYEGSWFRFRLSGTQRLWGIVEDSLFYPVWWDPNHEVCPNKES
jgi:hypothetical protein